MTTNAITVIEAASVTANYHVHIVQHAIPSHASVSVNTWTNQKTIPILVEARDIRITMGGSFGSGSGSTTMAIDVGPTIASGSGTFVNLASVSAPFTSVYPFQIGHTVRFRHTQTSAVAATGASVNVYIG